MGVISSRLLDGGRRTASADFFQAAIGGAQAGPIDIGTEVFAADGATCCALDGRAIIGRDVATPQPVINGLLCNLKFAGQCGLPTEVIDSSDECVHSSIKQHMGIVCQHMVFDGINNCCNFAVWG